jgi:hypothetical protein
MRTAGLRVNDVFWANKGTLPLRIVDFRITEREGDVELLCADADEKLWVQRLQEAIVVFDQGELCVMSQKLLCLHQ